MKEEIKNEPMVKPRNGYVYYCAFCGEDAGGVKKFCKTCGTQKGRQSILKENLEVLKQLREKGYCPEKVLLPVA